MARTKFIKPAVQDRPAEFSTVISTGNTIVQGTTILSGSVDISSEGNLNVGGITASSIQMDPVEIRSADGLTMGGSDTFTTSGPANKFTVDGSGNLTIGGVLAIPGFTNVSASLAAAGGGGGSTPTLQQVTDQGSSTTTPITASIISASGDIVAGNITSNGYNVISQSGDFVNNEFIVAVGTNAVTSSDALAVDSDGNLGIGTPNPEVRLHMLGEAAQTTQILMEQFNDTADAPDIRTRRYRGTSASRADVQTGDYLFRLNVHGQDGGSSELYGSMQFDVDGSDQDALNWKLQTRDTGGTVADRITIDSAGDINIPGDVSASGDLFSSKLEITNTSLDDSLLITTTEDSSTAGPVFTFKRNSSSPNNGDYLGQIKFKGENDANQQVVYAKITGKISDVTDTTEDGIIEFATKKAGSNVINARLTSTDLKLINGTGLEVNGDISTDGNVTLDGHISASSYVSASSFSGEGTGLTKLKRPIETHTSNFTASAALEGFFNIVGGTLECFISTSTATIGAEWEFFQSSSGDNFTFATGSGITLVSKDGNVKLSNQGSAATLKKITSNTYYLIGDLTA